MRLLWSPLAAEQAEEAVAYIAADDPVAAQAWVGQLLERVESLRRFPDSGRVLPELQREDIREIIVGAYRVVYRRREESVAIVAIRHQARDVDEDEIAP